LVQQFITNFMKPLFALIASLALLAVSCEAAPVIGSYNLAWTGYPGDTSYNLYTNVPSTNAFGLYGVTTNTFYPLPPLTVTGTVFYVSASNSTFNSESPILASGIWTNNIPPSPSALGVK